MLSTAIVSISEVSCLTGKTRATIHRHINRGKLSKIIDDAGNQSVDTSELIRVYGKINNTIDIQPNHIEKEQMDTGELNTLKNQLAVLEAENNALKDHLSSLKQALLLLEHKNQQVEVLTKIPKRKKFLGMF